MPSYTTPLSSLNAMTFNLLGGDDQIVIDMTNGNPIPAGGINYDGGTSLIGSPPAAPGDGSGGRLIVIGNAALSGAYTPSIVTPYSGSLTIGGRAISFNRVEPIEVSGFSSFTITTPGADDALQISSAAAGKNTIAGTSGGIAVSGLTFSQIATLTIDTAANDSGGGNDTLTVDSSGLVAAGLNLLRYLSGTGANALAVQGGSASIDANKAAGGTLDTTVSGGAHLRTGLLRQDALRHHRDWQPRHAQSRERHGRVDLAGHWWRCGSHRRT